MLALLFVVGWFASVVVVVLTLGPITEQFSDQPGSAKDFAMAMILLVLCLTPLLNHAIASIIVLTYLWKFMRVWVKSTLAE